MSREIRPVRGQLVPWILGTLFLGLFAKLAYRPMIETAGVNDLGLSGVLPNFSWAAFCSFLLACWSTARIACLTSLAANVVYELDQLRHDGFEDSILSSVGRTFDVGDLVAAAAGTAAAYVIMRRLAPAKPVAMKHDT